MSDVHFLTSATLQEAAVRCGSTLAQYATTDVTKVTCPTCRGNRCTCTPGRQCAACRGEPGERKAPQTSVLSEKDFLAQIMYAARTAGWLVYHTHNSLHSPRGFPDLVLAKANQPLIFAEVKSMKGPLAPSQEVWINTLQKPTTPPAVYVWRPTDWEEIVRILTA